MSEYLFQHVAQAITQKSREILELEGPEPPDGRETEIEYHYPSRAREKGPALRKELRTLFSQRNLVTPDFLEVATRWPPDELVREIKKQKKQLASVPNFRSWCANDGPGHGWPPLHLIETAYTEYLITEMEAIPRRQQYVTHRLLGSPDDSVTLSTARSLLNAIGRSHPPAEIIFELAGDGTTQEIYIELSALPEIIAAIEHHLLSHFPNAQLVPADDKKAPADSRLSEHYSFGAVLLRNFSDLQHPDPLAGFCTTLETLSSAERAALRIVAAPAGPPGSAFRNSLIIPEDDFNKKTAEMLWLASISLWAETDNEDRSSQIITALQQQLSQHTSAGYSLQRVLSCEPQPEFQSHYGTGPGPNRLFARSLLNTTELAAFIHPPHKTIPSQQLQRANMQSQKAPDELTQPTGLLLGTNEWRRQTKEVRLPHDFRSQHMYLLGASGSGKSTLLLNLIKQDIETGRGLAVIDPHGDLVNDTLRLIPKQRIADTVYIDMGDVDYPVSLNPFSVQPKERAQAADEFVLVFERMFLQDAQRAKHILYFTIASLLEAGNTTPLDIETFLTSRRFRSQILERLQTPRLIRFVDEDFAQYEKAVDPIVNKLARFSIKPEVSALLGQAKSHLNFFDIMQQKNILLLKLMPERQEDSQLIGGFLVSQLQLAAMRRNQLPIEQRVPFSLYIDEFQNFMSGSAEAFSKILSEARKYNLCLVLAHQYMGQLDDSVRQAIFANARSHIFFRTSPQDGQAIRLQLGSFTPEQVSAQARGQAIAAVTGTGQPFPMQTFPPPQPPATDFTAAIIEHTHRRYAVRPSDGQQAAAATVPDNSPPPPAPHEPPPADDQANILDDLFGKQ